MKKVILGFVLFVLIAVVYLFLGSFKEPIVSTPDTNEELSFLNIPDGFKISIVADGLENPRVITFDSKNRMLVSETKAGRVTVLEDTNLEKSQSDFGAGKNSNLKTKRVLIEGLNLPHGLDFFNDTEKGIYYLYIVETNQVARYPYDATKGVLVKTVGENIAFLPADGRHFSRTIAFGPNFRKAQIVSGKSETNTQVPIKLYISVGSSCDVCEENTWKRAAILESDPEGSYTAEFAGGLRNSVFFTFHPKTKEIWTTEMGRDSLGDNLPPDEVNIVRVAGPEHKYGARRYGWPFCYGDKVKDKSFNEEFERIDIPSDCSKTESPVIEIQAHSAPLGLVFIPSGGGWPKEWEGDLLVAYHGSWDRSVPTGYKVVRYNLDVNGNVLSQKPEDFISGWLDDSGKVLGRPVDLKFGPDGALYVSDDASGFVYRISP